MFGRSVLIFVFLLACLVVGTIAFIENQTGEDLFPHHFTFIPRHKITQAYLTSKVKVQYWWSKVTDDKPALTIESGNNKTDEKKPEIIKWQDKDGAWHFEYQTTPPANQKTD